MNLLAAILDATPDYGAAQPHLEAEDHGQPIRLDLHSALAVLGYYDGVYVVISDLPAGARLSAGRSNTNGTWSLLPDELEHLTILLAESSRTEFLLTVSIATPDPDGYDFASMTAQFHVHVAGGMSTVPFNSLKRIEALQQHNWADVVQRAAESSRSNVYSIGGDEISFNADEATPVAYDIEPAAITPAADADTAAWQARQVAAVRAECQADEEARFARIREQWQADAEELWTQRAAELGAAHAREMQEAEVRWQVREQDRVLLGEAMWSARLAASEIQWRAEESERIAGAFAQWQKKLRTERWRRAAAWFVFSVTIGSVLLT